jgi:hypothetical protein
MPDVDNPAFADAAAPGPFQVLAVPGVPAPAE